MGDEMKLSIMVVDDEENILNALRRELERVGRYSIETFKSAEAACIRAKHAHFDLLITDYRMPWMHGLTFMSKFTQLQPHAVTIVISGDAERALQHCQFNDISIPYLIRKPWQSDELLATVARALGELEVK